MSTRLMMLALGVVACALGTAAVADDYAQWRGPRRDGVSLEKNIAASWPAGGPKLLWQIKDAGFGYGSVSVAGERVVSIGSTGKTDEYVQARSLKDGKLLWQTRIGKVGNPDQQPNYPGARTTPTVVGTSVYALGSDGDLACLDTVTGKVVWQKNLQRDFGGKLGIWAYSESPLIDGDKVIVTPGGTDATVVALDRKTGAVIWKCAVPGADVAGYASAMLMESGGSKQVVQYMGKGLVGIDASTGKFLWRFDKTFDTRFQMHAFTPIIDGNQVYTGSASAQGLARVGAAGADAVYIDKRLPGSIGGAVKVGGYVYGGSQTGLMCVEFASGKVMWEDRSVGPNQICAVDGKLIVHGENGDVALVAATSGAYKELGRFTPAGAPDRGQAKAWAYPVVSGGKLFIRDLGVVSVYGIR